MIPSELHLTDRQKQENEYVKSLNFEYFDPVLDIIKSGVKNATITLSAKRRSGKSVLLKDICYKIKEYYSNIYLFSTTSDLDIGFWDFIPKKNIYYGIDEQALERIWNNQKETIKNSKETDKNKMPHVLIIFDDVIQSSTGVRHSDFLCNMYSNGRHYNVCSIMSVQSLKMVSKHARDNTDITMAFNFKNTDDKHDFVTENIPVDSRRIGLEILNKITGNEDYHCIAVLNYLNTSDLTRCVKNTVRQKNNNQKNAQ